MKVKIEQVNRFQITIGEKVYDDFKKCDKWEGTLKFSGDSGVVIVNANEGGFSDIFNGIFQTEPQKDLVDFEIIKITPSLILIDESA